MNKGWRENQLDMFKVHESDGCGWKLGGVVGDEVGEARDGHITQGLTDHSEERLVILFYLQ
jgi:hypothetical protein